MELTPVYFILNQSSRRYKEYQKKKFPH